MFANENETVNIIAGLPPIAKIGQLVTMDLEMFGQPRNKLHRPVGDFSLLSIKLEGDPNVYQIYDPQDVRKVLDLVKHGTWVFHNALYDLRQLRRWANIEPRFIWDTMLLEQCMRGGLYTNYGLNHLVRRWLGEYMEKETRDHFSELRELTPQMKRYAALDVIKTEAVLLKQLDVYQQEEGFRVYTEVDERMIFPILDMKGIRVDVEGWINMVREFEEKARQIQDELGFNVNSSRQVLEALRRREQLHLQDTRAETLAEFKDRPLVAAILECRMYRKAASTYGMKWLEDNVEDDGLVYSDYHITGAVMTGRMSSSNPNMQNIPARKLTQYRERFIASPGHVMGIWDVSQQEPCITAYHSHDKILLEALKRGESTHLAVAREIFDNPELTKATHKKEYDLGKQINLGLTYGLTAHGLAQRTGLSLEDAETMITKYFTKFRGVHAYIQIQRQKAMRDGYVTTALGRRSYLNLYDKKWENNAINSPIQGGAADFTKMWGYLVWEKTRAAEYPQSLVAFVHDETVYDTPREIAKEMIPIIREAFYETADRLYKNIPFAVEYEYGLSWAAKSAEEGRIDLEDEVEYA